MRAIFLVLALGLFSGAAFAQTAAVDVNREEAALGLAMAQANAEASGEKFSCSCHALDPSNPYNEMACNALQVGTTCARVGNIICIPRCQ